MAPVFKMVAFTNVSLPLRIVEKRVGLVFVTCPLIPGLLLNAKSEAEACELFPDVLSRMGTAALTELGAPNPGVK